MARSGAWSWRDGTKPLVVLVGKPWNDIFSLWRTEVIRIGARMLALILFVLAVTLFLAREIGPGSDTARITPGTSPKFLPITSRSNGLRMMTVASWRRTAPGRL